MREQRLPSSPSTAFPASSSALREDAVVLAGAQASTTCSPSTKHSGSLLPWLSGTQSSSSESLRTRLREAKENRRHHERGGVIMEKPGSQRVALRQPISQRAARPHCLSATAPRSQDARVPSWDIVSGKTRSPSPVHDGQAAALPNDSGAWDHIVL